MEPFYFLKADMQNVLKTFDGELLIESDDGTIISGKVARLNPLAAAIRRVLYAAYHAG